ncbi:hypothetical protein Q3G72_016458 [Acer saccharum]|nr:hypothetical protein Q3G72_016458 [Acer saccharum]
MTERHVSSQEWRIRSPYALAHVYKYDEAIETVQREKPVKHLPISKKPDYPHGLASPRSSHHLQLNHSWLDIWRSLTF